MSRYRQGNDGVVCKRKPYSGKRGVFPESLEGEVVG
jgi:hypothetical protein